VRLSPINCGPRAYARRLRLPTDHYRSEVEFASYLDYAASSPEGRDEIGRTNVRPAKRHEQIGVIEYIVKFSAKLKTGFLTDAEALVNAEIYIPETRSAEEIAPDCTWRERWEARADWSAGKGCKWDEIRCAKEIKPIGDSRIREGSARTVADGAQVGSRGGNRARARRFGRCRAGAIKHVEWEPREGLEGPGRRPAAEKPPAPAAVAAATTNMVEPWDFPNYAADEAMSHVEIGRAVIVVRVERREEIWREAGV